MRDIYSSKEELMGSKLERPRLLILNTISGSSLMCVVLDESQDSFLIALPAKLLSNDSKGTVEVDPYLPVPYSRFFKNSILFITPLFGTFEYLYIKYLLNDGLNSYPDALTDEEIKCLIDRLNVLESEKEQGKNRDVKISFSPDYNDDIDSDLEFVEDLEISDELNAYLESLNNKYKH